MTDNKLKIERERARDSERGGAQRERGGHVWGDGQRLKGEK